MNICSYFSNYDIDRFTDDASEMAEAGFGAILHPVSDIQVEYFSRNIRELIHQTKELGFTCFVDPHCIGKLFGYGNTSILFEDQTLRRMVNAKGKELAHICPSNDKLKSLLYQWLNLCSEADWVLWDEPNLSACFCEKCQGDKPMIKLLHELTYGASEMGIKSSIAFWGGRINPETYTLSEYMDDIGVSIPETKINDTEHISMWLSYISSLSRQLPDKTTSVWFPGYQIKSGDEKYLATAMEIADSHSITNRATWGWKGCAEYGYAGCEDPRTMWNEIGKVFSGMVECDMEGIND